MEFKRVHFYFKMPKYRYFRSKIEILSKRNEILENLFLHDWLFLIQYLNFDLKQFVIGIYRNIPVLKIGLHGFSDSELISKSANLSHFYVMFIKRMPNFNFSPKMMKFSD